MFGASKNCDQVVKCHKSTWGEGKKYGGACLLTTGCHAYRNSTFLRPLHLTQAVRALDQHKFVGLVEAYNSSILLIADIFGLNDSKYQWAVDQYMDEKQEEEDRVAFEREEAEREIEEENAKLAEDAAKLEGGEAEAATVGLNSAAARSEREG